MPYSPPFTISNTILKLVANISEQVGRLSLNKNSLDIKLRKINRMRTVQGSLAIEGNTLSEEQITAIIDGKTVVAPIKEVKEARNALSAYDKLNTWNSSNAKDLLSAHKELMIGLIERAGMYRTKGVGVMSGDIVVHMAPQAQRVPQLMQELHNWLKTVEAHPLITSCVFHYELEFIHPFNDGNGRIGRLWQTLILAQWHSIFSYLPVESLIHQNQEMYYQAIRESTAKTDSRPFIEFMLNIILNAINEGVSEDVNEGVKLDKKDKVILNLITKNSQVTQKEIIHITNMSKSTIERRIKKLKHNGILKRQGSDKTGYWQITQKT